MEQFVTRYPNDRTRQKYRTYIHQLIRSANALTLDDLTEDHVRAWVTTPGLANNTVRQRLSNARTLFRWCIRHGYVTADPTLDLDYLTRQYPKTYGKVQDRNPARWLTYEEAFTRLVGSCDDSPIGLRDQIVLRLGLAGIRANEIRCLTVRNLNLHSTPPTIEWTGKGRKPRHVVPGEHLLTALTRYLAAWNHQPDDALIAAARGNRPDNRTLDYGTPVTANNGIWKIVTTRAADANLGHVTPHDLRRTVAGILHDARTTDGAHKFDLLDIQQVLDHANPATTVASYINPLTKRSVKNRASTELD